MKFEVYQDKAGDWRWRLLASNGFIMATSGEGYTRKADCVKGLSRVQTRSIDARIVYVD